MSSLLTLLDITDRLSHNVACIDQAARSTVRPPTSRGRGRFTDALLSNKPVTSFIRDAYPGESRLLTVERDANPIYDVVTGADMSEQTAGDTGGRATPSENGDLPTVTALTRRQIVSATPLRRRNEVMPTGEGGDVFLKSALKLINRYQAASGSRQHILNLLEQYDALLKASASLRETLAEISARIPVAQKQKGEEGVSIKNAEQAVREMESRVAEAKQKREALKLKLHNLKNPKAPPPPAPIAAETSIASTDTWPSPAPATSLKSETLPSGLNFGNSMFANMAQTPRPGLDAKEQAFWGNSVEETPPSQEATEEIAQEGDEPEEDEVDETVILSFHPTAQRPRALDSPIKLPSSTQAVLVASLELASILQDAPTAVSSSDPLAKEDAVVSLQNGPGMEAAILKLWTVVGDVILPVHSYGKDEAGFPGTEETMSLLERQSAPDASTPGPAALMSTLCLYMLKAMPEPVPMPDAQKAVDELAIQRNLGGGVGMRIVYGCIAKKLLTVNRSLNPPTVAFDLL